MKGRTTVPDETDVTDSGGRPSLDDLADVAARTNAGIRALSEQMATLQAFALFAFMLLMGAIMRAVHLFGKVA